MRGVLAVADPDVVGGGALGARAAGGEERRRDDGGAGGEADKHRGSGARVGERRLVGRTRRPRLGCTPEIAECSHAA
ncbi:MAG: hypothetical protein AVDCRST_MAG11-2423 [uncultured Gemmatimonadaceae bacterium]|uniref:Uncharacterized protein n=1 Tax=uncultured Gemmatimonadaceae bacterium TaxID=246130 RepID=A0A6J4LEV3_9BACT|nr:MAG: hypothetical protein AVDCRST_MAG11-2423 [uncultured Gemmatimonadaceae bacterium]